MAKPLGLNKLILVFSPIVYQHKQVLSTLERPSETILSIVLSYFLCLFGFIVFIEVLQNRNSAEATLLALWEKQEPNGNENVQVPKYFRLKLLKNRLPLVNKS